MRPAQCAGIIARMRIKRPTHGTIVAYAALFTALGGTSYAAVRLPANTVTSATVRNNTIQSADLKDGSVKAVDLDPSLVPAAGNRVFRAAVADVVATSPDITIHVAGEKGDKGDPGVSVAGAQGASGPAGATGDPGSPGVQGQSGAEGIPGAPGSPGVKAYGHIVTDGNGDTAGSTTVGVTFTHPGIGGYCLTDPGMVSLVVTADAPNATPFVLAPGMASNTCPAGRWQVIVPGTGVDIGFTFVGN